MKGFFIITRTNEMHKHIESFTCLGNTESHYIFEHRGGGGFPSPQGLDADILKAAREAKPNIIIYVGACSGRMPTTSLFRELKTHIAPTVAFISDAGDAPWWPKVEEYDREKCFTVQVALDGAIEWPSHDSHITALTPLDPRHFPTPIKPHAERQFEFGFAGNPGAAYKGRMAFMPFMKSEGLQLRQRSPAHSDPKMDSKTYSEAAAHMSACRIMPNFAHTGSYSRFHVKGRVVEAGWAGCMLLETRDSPTRRYFTPGVDYLEFETETEMREILEAYRKRPELTQAFGERLRLKVERNHSPEVFWKRIFAKI